MRKFVLAAICGIGIGIFSANAAELVIKLRPPIAIREHRSVRPTPQHVWVGGYHRWDGNAYAWQPGEWQVPPREHAVWVAPRYTHRSDGYVFAEGHWR